MDKNRKRLVFLLSLCLLILAVITVKQYAPTAPFFHKESLLSFKDSEISQIQLIGESKSQTLVRQNDGWFVPKNGVNFQADTEKVNALLKVLHAITAETVVSRNKNKFADFGIGKQKITIEAKKQTYTLYVGTYYLANDVYARFDNREEVFIAGNLGEVNLDSDFRNLHLPLIGNPADVQSLRIEYQSETTSLVMSGKTWHLTDETPVSDTAVERYLEDATGLQADDILTRQAQSTTTPELTINLDEKGKNRVVRFYSHSKQNLVADIEGAVYMYSVPRAYVASLQKKRIDFIQPTVQP